MSTPFPTPSDDNDSVVFTLDSGIKLIGREWMVEYKFGTECILKDEPVDEFVRGFCLEVPCADDTAHLFVVNPSDVLKAYQELKQSQRLVVAFIDDVYLSSILIQV